MDLEYVPIVSTACCILQNFLIEERHIGRENQDKESKSNAPLQFEYISKNKKRSKNIAKQQRHTIFNN